MGTAAGIQRRDVPTRVATITGVVILAVLCGICLVLVFRGGGYVASSWLPLLIGTAALAVVTIIGGPALTSDRFQKILLSLFAAQAVWTVMSIIWASSRANAWEEANRTLFYALLVALAFVAVRWAGRMGLTALAGMVTGTVGIVAVATAVILATAADPLEFFLSGRLNYPVTYFNGLASFLMIGFWLTLGMANATGGRAGAPAAEVLRRARFPLWTQPLLLALSGFLVELALLPQSRGALWTFFLVVPFFVILSPNRFRALIDLTIVALPVVLFWDRINRVYGAISSEAAVQPALAGALRAMGYSVLIVLALWGISWVVERRVDPLSPRIRAWIGVTLIIVAVAGTIAAIVYADQRTNGLGGYVHDRWSEFLSDSGPGSSDGGSRFTAVGPSGRLTLWKVAGAAFRDNPVLGLGAQNFEIYFDQHRTVPWDVRQPHSQPMQLLAELGVPGLLLWLAFVALTLVRAGMLRFRSSGRATQAVVAAMMTAVISWFIHSSADWLWQLAAVSLPAMMLLGGLVGVSKEQLQSVPATDVARSTDDADTAPGAGTSRRSRSATRPPAYRRLIRPATTLLAVLVIVSAALPYLSLRYSGTAAGATASDPRTALARADTAAALDPTSTAPFGVRAGVHEAEAERSPEGSAARLAELKLAADDWAGATAVEPEGWLYYYNAAAAFLAAREAALAAGDASAKELDRSARSYLSEARRLNPLSPQITALEETF